MGWKGRNVSVGVSSPPVSVGVSIVIVVTSAQGKEEKQQSVFQSGVLL